MVDLRQRFLFKGSLPPVPIDIFSEGHNDPCQKCKGQTGESGGHRVTTVK